MFRIRFEAERKTSRVTDGQAVSIRQKLSSSSRNNRAGFDTRAAASQGMSNRSIVSPM